MNLEALARGAVLVTPSLPFLTLFVFLCYEFHFNTPAVLVFALKLEQVVFDPFLYLHAGMRKHAVVGEPARPNGLNDSSIYIE